MISQHQNDEKTELNIKSGADIRVTRSVIMG